MLSAFGEDHPRKAKMRQPPITEQQALRRHRGPRSRSISARRSIGYRGHAPDQSRGDLPTKTKIVLALPSYNRQRLSVIRRGWCPPRTRNMGIEQVVRSDASEAHRLSLSARVLSAQEGQVKAKRHRKKRLCQLRNQLSGQPYPTRPKQAVTGQTSPNRTFYPGNIGWKLPSKVVHLTKTNLSGCRVAMRGSIGDAREFAGAHK